MKITKVIIIYLSLIALMPSIALAQGLECRLDHSKCSIVYEFFRMDKIQEIRDRDTFYALRENDRNRAVRDSRMNRIVQATQNGRYSHIIANEIARMEFCSVYNKLLFSDKLSREDYNLFLKNCKRY